MASNSGGGPAKRRQAARPRSGPPFGNKRALLAVRCPGHSAPSLSGGSHADLDRSFRRRRLCRRGLHLADDPPVDQRRRGRSPGAAGQGPRHRRCDPGQGAVIGDFPACLAIIRKEEGGNDDDPHDHGGRTSRGITQREWDAYRATRPNLPADVWQAPNADIDAIYHDQYWAPYCDALPAGIDLVFFNTAVNSGRQQAVKELQRALGVEADGMLGMVTRQAVASYADIPGLIRKACALRRAYYRALAQFPRYGRGWLARTDRVEQSALLLA